MNWAKASLGAMFSSLKSFISSALVNLQRQTID